MACVRKFVTGAMKYYETAHNGNVLAAYCPYHDSGGEIQIYDMRTGRKMHTIIDIPDISSIDIYDDNYQDLIDDKNIKSIALSPTAPLLAATRLSCNNVYVWDYTTDACATVLCGHTDDVRSIGFSLDGRLLTSTSHDDTVRLWRTDDWTAPPTVVRIEQNISFFTSLSKFVLSQDSGSYCIGQKRPFTRALSLWHITPDLKMTHCSLLDISPNDITSIAFHPEMLAVGSIESEDQIAIRIRIIRFVNNMLGSVIRTIRSPDNEQVLSMAFSQCGRQLASGDLRNFVRLWDVATGVCVRVLPGHIGGGLYNIVYASQDKQLVTTTKGGTIRVWTLCPWSDRTHYLFGPNLKRTVFQLMCVRAWLPNRLFLPMELWLMVMAHLSLCDVIKNNKN